MYSLWRRAGASAREVAGVNLLAAILIGIVWFLGGLVLLVFLSLCTPLRLSASAYGLDVSESEGIRLDDTKWQLRGVWLLGLLNLHARQKIGEPVQVRLRLLGIPIKISTSMRQREADAEKKGGDRTERVRTAHRQARGRRQKGRLALHEIRSLLGELRWFLQKLLRTVRLQARGDLVYGFSDPAVTGWCEGLRHTLPVPRQLKLIPRFDEAVLQGWADVQLTIYPIRGAWVVVRGLFRKGVRRIWWSRLRKRLPWVRKARRRNAMEGTWRRNETY